MWIWITNKWRDISFVYKTRIPLTQECTTLHCFVLCCAVLCCVVLFCVVLCCNTILSVDICEVIFYVCTSIILFFINDLI